jgi:hypothetical protein
MRCRGIGFTGTPIESGDNKTQAVFDDYDDYDILHEGKRRHRADLLRGGLAKISDNISARVI